MKKISGIYKIESISTGRIYIGSAVCCHVRKRCHIRALKDGVHHSKFLQHHVNKYGVDDLIFSIVEVVKEKPDLIKKEQYYMDIIKPEFNMCKNAGSQLGRKQSESQKLRNAEVHRGNTYRLGMKTSEETKRRISIANKGKLRTMEQRKKLSRSSIGKGRVCKMYDYIKSSIYIKSQTELSKELNISQSSISKLLKRMNHRTAIIVLSLLVSVAYGQNVHNFLNQPIVLKASSSVAFGDSYTTCNGCSPTSAGYAPTMAANYGLSFTNFAVGGRGVWNFASNDLIQVNPGHSKFTIVGMIGLNDIRRNNVVALTMNKIANCVNAMIANQFLKSGYYPCFRTGTPVVKYGTWAQYHGLSVGLKTDSGAFSVLTGDSIVYRFTDTTLVIGLAGADGTINTYADFSVYLDNAYYGTFTENNQYDNISDGAYDNARGPMALIITGISNASHKVKLINLNGGGTKALVVDYFGHMVDPGVAMPIVFMEPPFLDSTGYSGVPSSGSDIGMIQGAKTLDSSVAVFLNGVNAANYPVFIGKTNRYFNPTMLGADHIHPTNPGYAQIAQAGILSINTQAGPPPSGKMFYLLNNKPYFTDQNGYSVPINFGPPSLGQLAAISALPNSGVTPGSYILSSVTVSATGIVSSASNGGSLGSNKQILYNNSGLVGGATLIGIDNANTRIGIGTLSPQYDLDVSGSPSGAVNIIATNTSNSGAAYAQILGFNDVGDFTRITQLGSGNAGSGMRAAHDGTLEQSGGNLDIIVNTGKVIKFGINGVEKMRLATGGNFLVGSSTDNSTAVTQFTSTSAQLATHYDATHYNTFTTSSAGSLNIAAASNAANITTDFTTGGGVLINKKASASFGSIVGGASGAYTLQIGYLTNGTAFSNGGVLLDSFNNVTVNGNLTLNTVGAVLSIAEGTNGRVGQTTLVAGTKAITISGLTTSSRAFVQLVTPNTVALTVQYKAVCTANTLTITADVAAGTINNVDVSTLNYFVIN